MLTLPVMGLLGLGILWVNTLLIMASTLKDLSKLRARLGSGTAVQARIAAGQVVRRVAQLGRLSEQQPAVVFWHDQSVSVSAEGLVVEQAGECRPIPAADAFEVWVRVEEDRAVAEGFKLNEALVREAGRPKGTVRVVEVVLPEATPLWLISEANDDRVAIVSTFDPERFVRQRSLIIYGVALPAIALTALGITRLSLWEPVFNHPISMLGGALGLAYFLLVLPLGTELRKYLKSPHERPIWGSTPVP